MLLPDETYERDGGRPDVRTYDDGGSGSKVDRGSGHVHGGVDGYVEEVSPAEHLLAVLKVYDEFLTRYRIRPEFFCRYVHL